MATHLPEEIDYNPLSPEARSNPEVQWGVLRRTQPVHHFALPEDELKKMSSNVFAAEPTTEFWTVLRHQHVEEVLSNPQLFLSCQGPGVDRMRPDPNGGVLIFADGKFTVGTDSSRPRRSPRARWSGCSRRSSSRSML
jgi:cytochrome P450